jgi:hypothetical protein
MQLLLHATIRQQAGAQACVVPAGASTNNRQRLLVVQLHQ